MFNCGIGEFANIARATSFWLREKDTEFLAILAKGTAAAKIANL
jgi:hypothetical protein